MPSVALQLDKEYDVPGAVQLTSEVDKLWSYGNVVADSLDTYIRNYQSKIRRGRQLDDQDDGDETWTSNKVCLERLHKNWDALCSPIRAVMNVKEELVAEHIELAVKGFLQPTQVEKIFQNGNITAAFALTPQAMDDTHAIDVLSGDDGNTSQELRDNMKRFHQCCGKALKEARSWIPRAENRQKLVGALDDELLDLEAGDSLLCRGLSLADTATFTSEDCELYASSFANQRANYKTSRQNVATEDDEASTHRIVESGLHFWTKYFGTQQTLCSSAIVAQVEDSVHDRNVSISNGNSGALNLLLANPAEMSVEECASALKVVRRAIQKKLAALDEVDVREGSRFSSDQFFSIIDSYKRDIEPAIFQFIDGPTKSEMGDTSVPCTSHSSRSSTPDL
ncbi:hypothetical protein QFC21_002552 [Naganishia friedmannii]|uniref:Uncharacterized protein n=1 Tax=Naganishia friedmannii TaxID=89922 RepID=A0ACC2VVK1_9TREE|nr:hypothetical protein QFC21_002552 [Naganishia friedmannii]